MKISAVIFLAAAFALLLAATPPALRAQPAASPPGAAAVDYSIGPEDVIEIRVWDNNDLSGRFAVSLEGLINYHLIGEVRAAGLTAGELSKEITRLLADGYIVNPQVNVRMLEYNSQKVFIMGEIKKPGTYFLSKKTTLVEAISMAGGPSNEAAREISIARQDGGSVTQITVDLRSALEGDSSKNIYIHNGDSIFLPRAKMFFIMGEVKSPGKYKLEPDTTVRKAISLASGKSETASIGRTRVIRTVEGKEVESRIGLDEIVQPNDTIIVPESFF